MKLMTQKYQIIVMSPFSPCCIRTRTRPITIYGEMQTLLINIDGFNCAIQASNE